MIKFGTKFIEFDDDIFEALIHSMIIEVRGDNKEFHPHIVTYIFNLCGESNSGEEKIVNIGSFELNYKYYVFDTDPETGVKNKILRNYVLCRIALKLESTSYYYPYTNCMGIFNNKKRILTLKEALIMLRYTINLLFIKKTKDIIKKHKIILNYSIFECVKK